MVPVPKVGLFFLCAQYPEPHRWLGRIFNRSSESEKVRYHLDRYLQLGGQDGDFKVREWLKAHPPPKP